MVERVGPACEGKVAIVTGAGSTPGPGIGTGKASAVLLAREGASVRARRPPPGARRGDAADDRGRGRHGAWWSAPTSPRRPTARRWSRAAVDAFGTVDILVNNIGLASLGTVVDTERGGLGPGLRHQPADRVPGVQVRGAGDGRAGLGLDREHGVDLGPAGRRHRRLLGGQGRPDRADRGHGLLARPPGHPGQRHRARPHHHPDGDVGVRARAPRRVHEHDAVRGRVCSARRARAGTSGGPCSFLASDEARWITGVTLPVDSGVLSVTPLMMAPHLRGVPGARSDDPRRRSGSTASYGRHARSSHDRPEYEGYGNPTAPNVSDRILSFHAAPEGVDGDDGARSGRHHAVRAVRGGRRRLAHHRAGRSVDLAGLVEVGRPRAARALPRAPRRRTTGTSATRSCTAPALSRRPAGPSSRPRTRRSLDEAFPAAVDARGRLAYIDQVGVHYQLLYPNILGFHSHVFLNEMPPELATECVRAYNDWLTEFCSADPRRLIPMMMLPFWDIDESVAEMKRAHDDGPQGRAVRGPLRQGRAAPPDRRLLGAAARPGPGDGPDA